MHEECIYIISHPKQPSGLKSLIKTIKLELFRNNI